MRADLRAGRLVEVLSDETGQDFEDIHALYVNGEHAPQRLRIFLDFMVPRLRTFLLEAGGNITPKPDEHAARAIALEAQ